jgi:hypothetical protein
MDVLATLKTFTAVQMAVSDWGDATGPVPPIATQLTMVLLL